MREWRHSSPVLDPGSRWRRKVSFTFRLLYSNPWHQLDKRLSEPQSQCGRFGEETSLLTLPGIEPWLFNQSLVAIPIKIISAAMNTIMNTAVSKCTGIKTAQIPTVNQIILISII
jgi:hypothetical protein